MEFRSSYLQSEDPGELSVGACTDLAQSEVRGSVKTYVGE